MPYLRNSAQDDRHQEALLFNGNLEGALPLTAQHLARYPHTYSLKAESNHIASFLTVPLIIVLNLGLPYDLTLLWMPYIPNTVGRVPNAAVSRRDR